MNAPAAIEAQLVDMRNVGTHKVLRLTIHVPDGKALAIIAAFGWPTGVAPVPIAIARLNESEVVPPDRTSSDRRTETSPRQEPSSPDGAKTKTAFRDMRLANQAGILCDTPAFRKFLNETQAYIVGDTPEDAAQVVRELCGVSSRSDIRPRCPSGDKWTRLVDEYRTWMHEVV